MRKFPTKSYMCLFGSSHSTTPLNSSNVSLVNICAVCGKPCKIEHKLTIEPKKYSKSKHTNVGYPTKLTISVESQDLTLGHKRHEAPDDVTLLYFKIFFYLLFLIILLYVCGKCFNFRRFSTSPRHKNMSLLAKDQQFVGVQVIVEKSKNLLSQSMRDRYKNSIAVQEISVTHCCKCNLWILLYRTANTLLIWQGDMTYFMSME